MSDGAITDHLYVATDSSGIEHGGSGDVVWSLPATKVSTYAASGEMLTLRTAFGLLEVFDEAIFRADPLTEVLASVDGTVHLAAARLISQANWSSEIATRFALSCAEHILGEAADLTLPDGTSLGEVITRARTLLDELEPDAAEHLGYLARLSALRRLRRERSELGDISLAVLTEDELNDFAALDDPAYATVIPITDAVLASIEALRHHLLPGFDIALENRRGERDEHEIVDGPTELKIPSTVVTPFGSALVGGGPRVTAYEPSWTGAREAARHARMAVLDRSGEEAERLERTWQAAALSALLESS